MAIVNNFLNLGANGSYALVDERDPLKIIADTIVSLFKQLQYSLNAFFYKLFHLDTGLSETEREWTAESKGLVVLVHGLNNSPAAWNTQLKLLQGQEKIDLFAPKVTKKGLCTLEEAGSPILPTLLSYARQNSRKPICLLGTSNGGRIVTWLEVKLREESPETPVMVSSVAGVHFGSSMMTKFDDWGLARFRYPESLRQELRYGSEKASRLLDRVKAPLPENCAERSYEFYATTEDLTIPDLDSTLPNLEGEEQHYLFQRESHSSIVHAVAQQQVNSCLQWIDRF